MTRELRKYKERNVSGPQMPSADSPYSRWYDINALWVCKPKCPSTRPGVEAEVLQPGLQRRDVVTVERGAELVIQRARAEPVGGLLQRAVGGLADNAVDQQSAMLLEGTHRLVEFVVEQLERHMPAGGQVFVGIVQQP